MGYKSTEVGMIPQDWRVSTIGAEFRIQLGKMLDAAKNTGVSKPYIGNRSVQWGRIDLDGISTVLMSMSDLQRFRLRRGDLLVCEGGEIGRAAIWDDLIPECYYQKAIHRLRPIETYNVYLMMCLLQLWTSNGYLSNYVTQTSIAHLPKDKLEIVPLPVPPNAEQQAIAEALSDVDGLLTALEALIAKKRAIKQAAMQQLLTGKTRLPGFSGAWEIKRVSEFGDIVTGATPRTDIDAFWGEQYPWITPTDISFQRDMISSERMITQEGLNSIRTLPANCVLVTCIASIGKNAILKTKGSCNQQINAVIPNVAHSAEFLYYLFELNTRYLLAKAGITATSIVSKKIFGELSFKIPFVDEQRTIATALSEMDAEIVTLEQRRDKARAIKQGMMQQLLTGRIRLINEVRNK